jgi:hypothetical protein
MPGVSETVASAPIGKVVEHLALILQCLVNRGLKDQSLSLAI